MAAELTQDQPTMTRKTGEDVSAGNHFFSSTRQYTTASIRGQRSEVRACDTKLRNQELTPDQNFTVTTTTRLCPLVFIKPCGTLTWGGRHVVLPPKTSDKNPENAENNEQEPQQSSSQVFVSVCFTVRGSNDTNSYLIFGSGTTLYVSDEQVVKPVVSVYPAASRAHLEGKSSLLCLASHMFPPEVKFSWKRQKEGGSLEDLTPAEGEQLELRESGIRASIRLLQGDDVHEYRYQCSVEHEGDTVEAKVLQEVPVPPPPPPPPAPPAAAPHWYKERLFCFTYTLLIVKSLVYCCGLSLLMSLRNKGPSTSSTHAD
ncbi:uncharacterized protein LOC125010617 [Mugil cephalus]|uniref:uncharacterized protein LOC125010617 n=1 Tax=Mugil cephalus TaxID=48193 RepID=UPI001FB61277|nr:uncharacterized protein LOC125010617 [Mugil cephalus]